MSAYVLCSLATACWWWADAASTGPSVRHVAAGVACMIGPSAAQSTSSKFWQLLFGRLETRTHARKAAQVAHALHQEI